MRDDPVDLPVMRDGPIAKTQRLEVWKRFDLSEVRERPDAPEAVAIERKTRDLFAKSEHDSQIARDLYRETYRVSWLVVGFNQYFGRNRLRPLCCASA